MSPDQIGELSRILSPPPPAPHLVRRCKTSEIRSRASTCFNCQTLPEELRVVVEAVLKLEGKRGRSPFMPGGRWGPALLRGKNGGQRMLGERHPWSSPAVLSAGTRV